jgi:hypothetical protein
MSLSAPLPLDRVHLVNPGQQVAVGNRTLTAGRPPTFDNPCTTGFHDDRPGVLVSADSFGALLADVPQMASDLSDETLRAGRSSGPRWTHRGCTTWTEGRSPRNFKSSAGWNRP